MPDLSEEEQIILNEAVLEFINMDPKCLGSNVQLDSVRDKKEYAKKLYRRIRIPNAELDVIDMQMLTTCLFFKEDHMMRQLQSALLTEDFREKLFYEREIVCNLHYYFADTLLESGIQVEMIM